jgi:hypothetical protein
MPCKNVYCVLQDDKKSSGCRRICASPEKCRTRMQFEMMDENIERIHATLRRIRKRKEI